jgi:hypothetical protein
MSRLDVPVLGRTLWHTGDILLRADLDLLLKDGAGKWPRESFLVDTGSELTTMPAYDAKRLGFPVPQAAAPAGVVHRQTGLAIRSGLLRFRVAGMDQTEYAVPCFFLGDPDTPPAPGQAATLPRRLLQPLGLLGQLRFTLDRDATANAPYGTLAVEKKTP